MIKLSDDAFYVARSGSLAIELVIRSWCLLFLMKYDKMCAMCLVLQVLVDIWLRLVIGSWCLHALMKYDKTKW